MVNLDKEKEDTMGSGEGDAYDVTKRIRTEYEIRMAEKMALRKAPAAPKNPEKEYIRRKGR